MAEKKDVTEDARTGTKKKTRKTPVKKVEKKKRAFITSPAVVVKEKFGSKEKLIEEVKKIFDKTDIFIDKLNKVKVGEAPV